MDEDLVGRVVDQPVQKSQKEGVLAAGLGVEIGSKPMWSNHIPQPRHRKLPQTSEAMVRHKLTHEPCLQEWTATWHPLIQ